MVSRVEEQTANALRALLDNKPVDCNFLSDDEETERLGHFLADLQFFVPDLLREIHPEWDRESLDGFQLTVARKTDELEAEFFGLCILISDQTLTPIHVCLKIDAEADEVTWMECRLGERGDHGMVRTPYGPMNAALRSVIALNGRPDRIDWVYKAGFGSRDI